MGAVKLLLYRDGTVDIFIFDNNGKNMSKKVQAHIRCKEKQLLELAVILRAEADDCSKWDANIESIDTDINVSAEMMNNFLNQKSRYNEIKNMRTILNQRALVSKKIIDKGWKVGFMYRCEPNNPSDSGWTFLAGNEDAQYTADANNIVLMQVGNVCNYLDKDIYKYIAAPVGTELIRISENEFEADMKNKEIFMAKRAAQI